VFERALPGRLDAAEAEWHAAQPPDMLPPVVTHHAINPELQTGDSQLLGGPMSIHAPWERQ
jgi:hypothetical protein